MSNLNSSPILQSIPQLKPSPILQSIPELRIDIEEKEINHWCGHNQRDCVVYVSQLIICLIVIVSAILNISLNSGLNNQTWLVLLSSCLGYLLPSPSMPSQNK